MTQVRLAGLIAVLAVVAAFGASGTHGGTAQTVWLCKPGLAHDPCTANLATTVISAAGQTSTVGAAPAAGSKFDCFYVYPTVSAELSANSDLKVQSAETDVAIAQASRFSSACRVYAPMYRQVTLATLFTHPSLAVGADEQIAYTSLLSGFDDYLAHENDGRPIVFIGHSQGAAILIRLLAHVVDGNAALRNRLVLAVILGGDVEVHTGSLTGGSFAHIPLCSHAAQAGCVIAYSTFPGEPPATALFGRVGQGVALQSGETGTAGLQVACVNPAAVGSSASATLSPYFPSLGKVTTPWVSFPGLYRASCRTAGGATWLQVEKATGSSDRRPIVTEKDGPDWGYHTEDVNLALGNLVADVFAAERSWTKAH